MPAPAPTSKNPEVKTIANVYGAFVASLLLSFVPDPVFAIVATIFFLGVLISAYLVRRGAEPESLTENHMTWIIRTIWIAGLFAIVTIAAGGMYLWTQLDYTSIQSCASKIGDLVMQGGTPSTYEMLALMEPCEEQFMHANRMALIISTIIAAGPLVLYLVLRLTKGIARAAKGYRLANPKEWF
jgi:uncharacterized membrane protein YfcA